MTTWLCTKHDHVTNFGVRCHYCIKEENEREAGKRQLFKTARHSGTGLFVALINYIPLTDSYVVRFQGKTGLATVKRAELFNFVL